MYVYLYHVLVRHHYDRITDGFQISLKVHLHLNVKYLVEHNDKLGAVPEFDLGRRLGFQTAPCRPAACMSCARRIQGQVDLLAEIGVISALENLH